jgi:hypothetical protein
VRSDTPCGLDLHRRYRVATAASDAEERIQ